MWLKRWQHYSGHKLMDILLVHFKDSWICTTVTNLILSFQTKPYISQRRNQTQKHSQINKRKGKKETYGEFNIQWRKSHPFYLQNSTNKVADVHRREFNQWQRLIRTKSLKNIMFNLRGQSNYFASSFYKTCVNLITMELSDVDMAKWALLRMFSVIIQGTRL